MTRNDTIKFWCVPVYDEVFPCVGWSGWWDQEDIREFKGPAELQKEFAEISQLLLVIRVLPLPITYHVAHPPEVEISAAYRACWRFGGPFPPLPDTRHAKAMLAHKRARIVAFFITNGAFHAYKYSHQFKRRIHIDGTFPSSSCTPRG
jgi:hypothetical protein